MPPTRERALEIAAEVRSGTVRSYVSAAIYLSEYLLRSEPAAVGAPGVPAKPLCTRPPPGWICTRGEHPDGPCAAVPEPRATLAASQPPAPLPPGLTLGFAMGVYEGGVYEPAVPPPAPMPGSRHPTPESMPRVPAPPDSPDRVVTVSDLNPTPGFVPDSEPTQPSARSSIPIPRDSSAEHVSEFPPSSRNEPKT